MLKDYLGGVEEIRELGRELHLDEDEIETLLEESFHYVAIQYRRGSTSKATESRRKWLSRLRWTFLCILLLAPVILFSFLYSRQVASNVERNIQELIYPGMKLLRKTMLPFVTYFPSLTELYDEACLITNPYFQASDLDCWPCERARTVLNLTSSSIDDDWPIGLPIVLRDPRVREVGLSDVKLMYESKMEIFDRDAPRIKSTSTKWTSARELFTVSPIGTDSSERTRAHITWRLNRLEPTREARTLFGSPSRTPNHVASIAMEKYILIDEPDSPTYVLPSTEGTNIFLIQGSGKRMYVLNPSPECRDACHRVSVLLEPNHVLWFSWWYWRATSVPVHSDEIAVGLLGSYF